MNKGKCYPIGNYNNRAGTRNMAINVRYKAIPNRQYPTSGQCIVAIIVDCIPIRHHVESDTIELTYCPTQEMTADIFTKPLPRPLFNKHVLAHGLAEAPEYRERKFQKLNGGN